MFSRRAYRGGTDQIFLNEFQRSVTPTVPRGSQRCPQFEGPVERGMFLRYYKSTRGGDRLTAWVVEDFEGVPDKASDEGNLLVVKLPELALGPVFQTCLQF